MSSVWLGLLERSESCTTCRENPAQEEGSASLQAGHGVGDYDLPIVHLG